MTTTQDEVNMMVGRSKLIASLPGLTPEDALDLSMFHERRANESKHNRLLSAKHAAKAQMFLDAAAHLEAQMN